MLVNLNGKQYKLYLGDKPIAQGWLAGKKVYEAPVSYTGKITLYGQVHTEYTYDGTNMSGDPDGTVTGVSGGNIKCTPYNPFTIGIDRFVHGTITYELPIESITIDGVKAPGTISGNIYSTTSEIRNKTVTAVLRDKTGMAREATAIITLGIMHGGN